MIDLERFLTSGQRKRIDQQLTQLQKDTGIKVRLLCQRCVVLCAERWLRGVCLWPSRRRAIVN